MHSLAMTEYDRMKSVLVPILEGWGFRQVEERLEPDVFGSAYTQFSSGGLSYRIVWDGKDGCGYIQSYDDGEWVNLKASAPEARPNEFEEFLAQMSAVLTEHKAMGRPHA
ncbi:MAG: hypothetical protein WD071_06890 [Pseudohongiella sp.]|uniref:hypothetical protein n=1 Tax=Pseudohongiella sp. TaxID=1979412 RepID=UPI00349FD70D